MTAREDILATIRGHHPLSRELPEIPTFERGHRSLVDRFAEALALLDGATVTEPPADPERWLAETFPDARRVCSAVRGLEGTVTPADFSDWAAPADVDVSVARTPLGVAETGSILLSERELGVDTIAVLARHLVVLLDPDDLVENVHDAYHHPHFETAAYAVLLSGPSGSADIGGTTVHPAQGVTTLTVILTPRSEQERAHAPNDC